MSRPTRARRPFNPYTWVVTRVRLHCHRGDHEVPAGTWMRYRRGDWRRLGSCQHCLATLGVPSPGSFTFHADREDVRARQVGDDE